MRIAVLTSSYPRFLGDGAAPFVQSICEQLAQLGHQVHVVAPYDPAVRFSDQSVVQVRRFRYIVPARWHMMGHARALDADTRLQPLAFLLLPLFLVFGALELARVTQRQGSDLIYAHWVLPNGPIAVTVAWWRRIPVLISLHGSDIFIARRNRIFGAVARWVFRHTRAVTACSPELQSAALALGAPRDIRLLAWGADPQVFRPVEDVPACRARWGWPPDTLVILAAGRLVPKKGFDVLIRALSPVVARYPQTRLVIAGDGTEKGRLIEEAARQHIPNHVIFLGRVAWDRMPDLLASADLFVLPSRRDDKGNMDGLPTVLLEAMSTGLPVIASRIGGVELVVRDDENGILVSPGQQTELTEALLALVGDETRRRTIGRVARRAVEMQFNWERVARQIEEIMQSAVCQ